MQTIFNQIATALSVKEQQVAATVKLLDEGATVPFIARYRKEVTNNLNDEQLRQLEQQLSYLRALEERKSVIIKTIQDQGKLSDVLKDRIHQASTKTELEDLYLPYKAKRRTKAQIAREAGLAPLTEAILQQPQDNPEALAKNFINDDANLPDIQSVLEGARHLLMETISENAQLLTLLRQKLWRESYLTSTLLEKTDSKNKHKFKDYFDYSESIKSLPNHRALALIRGRNEKVLNLQLIANKTLLQDPHAPNEYLEDIAKSYELTHDHLTHNDWLKTSILWTWRIKLLPKFETEFISQLKEKAEEGAIAVFAQNLRDLLMAAPAGSKTTMGLDPGLRTGVKVAIVNATGDILEHTTIFPHAPQNQWQAALNKLATLCKQHAVELISIGNGTASRETDKLVKELQKTHPELSFSRITVSEAGASVYSASALASEELPDLDVSIRGAVSIARRLQDPLAELVKIEPKSIGVGQYQHDVSQHHLTESLNHVVEDCVNAVGVDLNTASVQLLSRISGLNKTLASNIVQMRQQQGPFQNRQQLLEVERLGPKAFEQSAGFLRITNGEQPLDATTIHPESYHLVQSIQTYLQQDSLNNLIGNTQLMDSIQVAQFSQAAGIESLLTVSDIIDELKKPARDPRGTFITPEFKEGVDTIDDLTPHLTLEGVVTNITDFGAFVDIGVHQDGLVHISMMSHHFIKHPREHLKTGDIIKVHVVEVDTKRKRITLSMIDPKTLEKSSTKNQRQTAIKPQTKPHRSQKKNQKSHKQQAPTSALGMALAQALKNNQQ